VADERAGEQGELADLVGAETRLAIWAKNQVELAKHLGCDRKSISRWLKEKDPECPGAMPDGRYNVTLWKLWTEKKGKKPSNRLGMDKGGLELEKLRLQNEKLELENRIKRGELMDIDEVCGVLSDMVSGFVKVVRGRKHSLAPQVIGVGVPEATKRIDRSDREALNELALGDWTQKKTFWSSVSAALSVQRKRHNLGDGLNAM